MIETSRHGVTSSHAVDPVNPAPIQRKSRFTPKVAAHHDEHGLTDGPTESGRDQPSQRRCDPRHRSGQDDVDHRDRQGLTRSRRIGMVAPLITVGEFTHSVALRELS